MGGTEQNGVRLARFLASKGEYENQIIATSIGDQSMRAAFEEISPHGVFVLPPNRVERLIAFNSVIRKSQPIAIVFHFFNVDQALMAMTARLAGVKRCIAAAGTAATDLSAANRFKWKIALQLNRVSKTPIISASKWIENSLARISRLPRGSQVIHNGIEVESFRRPSDFRSESTTKEKSWTLGMVARLEGAKDHETLIRSFAQFLNLAPKANARLRLIGDGPLRKNLENLVKSLGISDNVDFLGTRLDVPEQLAQLDTFVFSTTQKEGFGNVLIEAMAAGIPIIANDVPSSREVLRDGQLGSIVLGGRQDAWVEALVQHWSEGPSVRLPEVDEIKAIYGIVQFCNGYIRALKLTPDATSDWVRK